MFGNFIKSFGGNEGMDMLRISWEATINYCEELGRKIDFRPDLIVGLSRGGLVLTRILSDIMAIERVGIIGIKFYDGMRRMERPEVFQELTMDVRGRKILLVDDVAETGRSLEAARAHLLEKGAAEVKIATLHYKPTSSFRPDYFVMTTTSWIAYPWERHEIERETRKRG